jgi:DNA repair exonuclease SbcCD ATPase subunit
MKGKVLLALLAAVFLLSIVLTGCIEGVTKESYDKLVEQYNKAREQVSKQQDTTSDLNKKISELQSEKTAVEAELQTAHAKIKTLQEQLGELQVQHELVGATPAETAANIVRYYHDTHLYSTYDLFVCSDMASDVWNMLKAQGIDARIVVGDKDNAIGDILLSNHAWVQAEVAPGEYLALETTGGFVVPESENPFYYRGWYFSSPAELKSYNELVREYNTRIGIRNQIAAEANKVRDEQIHATSQSEIDKLEAVHEKLMELIEMHEAEIIDTGDKIKGLATKCRT